MAVLRILQHDKSQLAATRSNAILVTLHTAAILIFIIPSSALFAHDPSGVCR